MDQLRREGLERAIREHLTKYGARDWKLVTERFADVPHASFWRAVKAVRAEAASRSKDNNRSSEILKPIGSPLLFPPYCQPLQKLAEYQALIQNAQDLIEQAKGPGGKIKKWQMHAKGVSLRESIVRNQVEVMGELTNLEKTNCFWQAIIDIVGELAPHARDRVIARFQELNDLDPEARELAVREIKSVTKPHKGGKKSQKSR